MIVPLNVRAEGVTQARRLLYAQRFREIWVLEPGDLTRTIDPDDVEATETLVPIYSDPEGAVPVDQPLLSNATGSYPYFLDAATVDLYEPANWRHPITRRVFVGPGDVATGDLDDAIGEAVTTANAFSTALVGAPPAIEVITGTAYTLAAGDEENVLKEFTAAGLVTVTLPKGADDGGVAEFVEGVEIAGDAIGAAGLTLAPGTGVAPLQSISGLLHVAQFGGFVARYRGSSTWIIRGELS